jgi:outer membrane receptor protein involved in Fe transport
MTQNKHTSGIRSRYLPASLLALLATTPAFSQQAATPSAAETPAAADEDIVVLSPFIVDATKDHGYYAENTLAGSRLNTKISDLAPSISVITKQLMEDTASTDINDIFRYEINTEGALTYTPGVQSMRSDGIADVNSGFASGGVVQNGTVATSNRVRGLGSPTASINYYAANSAVPMDAYNVSSVEINRGPNSMLFGMGSPAGIVNQSWATAQLGRDTNQVSLRVDSLGSMRGSFSFNRALIKDKLGIYGAFLAEDRNFERRPSYDNSRRMYGSIKYKPFSGTTITASVESFKNDNRRPNSLTPRDFVTTWKDAGSPIYDSVNRTVTKANGEVVGIYVPKAGSPYAQSVRDFVKAQSDFDPTKWNAAKDTYNGVSIFGDPAMTNTASIMYVGGMYYQNKGRSTQQIADGQLVNWFQPSLENTYRTIWGTAGKPTASAATYPTEGNIWLNNTWSSVYNSGWTTMGGGALPTTVGSYKYPAVSDKSIYDWEDVNLNQMNWGQADQMSYNLEIEQQILSNLYLSAGWFRQDYTSNTAYTVSQLNVATLFVDTNKYYPDGTPNPYVGQVFVEDQDADRNLSDIKTDNYRVMLAYTPDFTKNKNWTKWFGRHQILGMWSGTDSKSSLIRQRMTYVAADGADGMYRFLPNMASNADGSPSGWNFGNNGQRRQFYLSEPGDPAGAVTRSSGEWNELSYTGTVRAYDYATSSWRDYGVTQQYMDHFATTGANQRKLRSLSGGITSYLWDDRLVATFGIRQDKNKTRAATNDVIQEYAKGPVVTPKMTEAEKYIDGVYQTDTVLERWNYWDELVGTTRTIGGVFKPFKGWTKIERSANNGSIWNQFLRDFGVSYNKSSNFDAPATSKVDAFGTPLPKPQGEGKDYGFQFSLFDNKFFARVIWFEGTNENEQTNPGSSISRLTGNIDTTLFRNWARTIAMINMGRDPTTKDWDTLSTTEETAVQEAAEKIWGMDYDYYSSVGSIYATRNAEAKGIEVQLNYNPVPNWTMRVTAGKQTTVYSNVLKEFTAWYDYRSPVWDNARAADYLLPQYQQFKTYTMDSGRNVDLTNFWGSYGYRAEIRDDEPNGYYNAKLYYDGVVTPQIALARDKEGQAADGQRRYRWSYMTNYKITTGRLNGFSFGGSLRWEDKAVIGYYGKSSGASTVVGYMDMSDITRPIYDSANWYTDLWIGYSRKIMRDKVNMKIQLNVDNVFEDGGLRVVSVNYDGSPYAYRIIDSRLFKLTTTFDF